MSFGRFLEEHGLVLLLQAFLMVLGSIYLQVTGTRLLVVVVMDLVWLGTVAAVYGIGFYRQRRRLRELWDIYDALDEKYLFTEVVSSPRTQLEETYFELSRVAGKAMLDAIEASRSESAEYKEYIERWIHEVKTPITAAGLICKNHPGEDAPAILGELAKIDQLVEQALFYARSGSVEKDYFIKGFPIMEAVIPAVQNYRSIILGRHIELDIGALEDVVYSDKKWVIFILQQLISNAVKYVPENNGRIRIYTSQVHGGTWLTVEDNGCGIAESDLPRIFDKGFTGGSRSNKQATGMGLYLSRKLCKKLGLTLEVTSMAGAWTKALVGFPAGSVHQNF